MFLHADTYMCQIWYAYVKVQDDLAQTQIHNENIILILRTNHTEVWNVCDMSFQGATCVKYYLIMSKDKKLWTEHEAMSKTIYS